MEVVAAADWLLSLVGGGTTRFVFIIMMNAAEQSRTCKARR